MSRTTTVHHVPPRDVVSGPGVDPVHGIHRVSLVRSSLIGNVMGNSAHQRRLRAARAKRESAAVRPLRAPVSVAFAR
jgi:hypothetical protein